MYKSSIHFGNEINLQDLSQLVKKDEEFSHDFNRDYIDNVLALADWYNLSRSRKEVLASISEFNDSDEFTFKFGWLDLSNLESLALQSRIESSYQRRGETSTANSFTSWPIWCEFDHNERIVDYINFLEDCLITKEYPDFDYFFGLKLSYIETSHANRFLTHHFTNTFASDFNNYSNFLLEVLVHDSINFEARIKEAVNYWINLNRIDIKQIVHEIKEAIRPKTILSNDEVAGLMVGPNYEVSSAFLMGIDLFKSKFKRDSQYDFMIQQLSKQDKELKYEAWFVNGKFNQTHSKKVNAAVSLIYVLRNLSCFKEEVINGLNDEVDGPKIMSDLIYYCLNIHASERSGYIVKGQNLEFTNEFTKRLSGIFEAK